MLKNRIDNELGNLVHIVDVIGYYELDDERLKGIDFIISSIDLSNLVFSVPVFTVSIFLNTEDLKYMKQKIAKLKPIGTCLPVKAMITFDKDSERIFDEYILFYSNARCDKRTSFARVINKNGARRRQEFCHTYAKINQAT